MENKLKPCRLDHEVAKKCSDYDNECVDVRNHFACWQGDLHHCLVGPADGYCPFVIGMEHPSHK